MSSISLKNKHRIVLFQGGLYDDGTGFNTTINNLKTMSSEFNVSDLTSSAYHIDMTNYNVANRQFYKHVDGSYVASSQAKSEFENLISNIVNNARADVNKGKVTLVTTFLNQVFDTDCILDSIENQKDKLVRIIDEFKKNGDIEIILVGHSQGGLVNLEAAISRCTKIAKVISISTPYAPVFLADSLVFLDFLIKLGGTSAYELFTSKDHAHFYQSCAEKLASETYFNDLKARWNACGIRPELTVITSTAGIMKSNITKNQPFDGLVKLSEMTAISHANFIHLTDSNVPCYATQNYAQGTCSTTGFNNTCNYNCTFTTLSLGGLIWDTIVSYVNDLMDGAINLEEPPAITAINAGYWQDSSLVPPGYENYYNVAAHNYNHNHIRKRTITASYLIALLTT